MSQSSSENNALARQRPRFSVAIETEAYRKLVNNTIGDPIEARRFIAAITSAVAVNAQLQDCDAGTILACGLLGNSLGLAPSPQLGQYYIVPFECKVKDANGKTVYLLDAEGKKIKDDKGRWIAVTEKKAQFVLGYRGYIQLAIRSGQYRRLNVIEIKEGELHAFDPLNEIIDAVLIDDADAREKAPTAGYYAMFEYINGFRKAIYWTKGKMLGHADRYSAAFSAEAYKQMQRGEIAEADMWKYSSYWYKNFDDMAKKTMLRQLISKWGIMSVEMQTAIEQDSTLNEIGKDGQLITTSETQLEPAQQNYELVHGEAAQVVEKVDLSEL